jgi:hypothetical protein
MKHFNGVNNNCFFEISLLPFMLNVDVSVVVVVLVVVIVLVVVVLVVVVDVVEKERPS